MHIMADIDRMVGMTLMMSIGIMIDIRSMMGSASTNENRKIFSIGIMMCICNICQSIPTAIWPRRSYLQMFCKISLSFH